MLKSLCFIMISCCWLSFSFGQFWQGSSAGIQVGASMKFGTHINQLGLKIQGFYFIDYVQFNGGTTVHFNFTNLAHRKKYIENRINIGAVGLLGLQTARPKFIIDGLMHQTSHEYAVAYNYVWYFDNAGTNQRNGGMGFHIKDFSLLMENDFFAGQGRDRFRTSSGLISYQHDDILFKIDTKLWTGETWGTVLVDTLRSIHPKGFKDLRNTHLGRESHGIFAFGVDIRAPFENVLNLEIGIDSERIRNGLQNKFMHNKKFIPEKWRKQNLHYPMLDKNGFPTSYPENARATRFYFQSGLNGSWSY